MPGKTATVNLGVLDYKLDQLGEAIDRLESKLDSLNLRMTAMEIEQAQIKARLTTLESLDAGTLPLMTKVWLAVFGILGAIVTFLTVWVKPQ